jgi:hypothetical protein
VVDYSKGLISRFEETGDLSSLRAAKAAARYVVAHSPDDAGDRAAYLSNLAVVLRLRYQSTGDTAALDEAIDCLVTCGADMKPTDRDRGAVAATAFAFATNGRAPLADLESALEKARSGASPGARNNSAR